jgi:hypothetical protein
MNPYFASVASRDGGHSWAAQEASRSLERVAALERKRDLAEWLYDLERENP